MKYNDPIFLYEMDTSEAQSKSVIVDSTLFWNVWLLNQGIMEMLASHSLNWLLFKSLGFRNFGMLHNHLGLCPW